MVSTHRFLFPIPDTSIVFKQFRTSSICLEVTVEDAGSPGEPEASEGGGGELNVDMGERKKRDCVTFKLAFIYMHITEESGSLGYRPGPGPYSPWRANRSVGEAGPGR